MRFDLARHAPPGIDLRQELQFFITGAVCAAVYSMLFLLRYFNARGDLYWYDGYERILRDDVVMPDFAFLLERAFAGFQILALAMAVIAALHYFYHRQGSKSIYLMRRLPDGFELHRRCLTLPLLAAALCLLVALLLLLLYFAVYMLATPEQCLTPGQWQKLWTWRGRL